MSKKEKILQTKGKKKTAVARLRIKKGKGVLKINGKSINSIPTTLAKEIMNEPIKLAENVLGKDFFDSLDISINVKGGGIRGQAYACRTAIGKALIKWTENEDLKKLFTEYDRTIVVDDVRRTESKKCLRKGARAKPTKSYR